MQVADRPLTFRNAFLAGALDVPGQRSLRRTRWQSGKQEIFIGSDNVEGTAVYGADRQSLGLLGRGFGDSQIAGRNRDQASLAGQRDLLVEDFTGVGEEHFRPGEIDFD